MIILEITSLSYFIDPMSILLREYILYSSETAHLMVLTLFEAIRSCFEELGV